MRPAAIDAVVTPRYGRFDTRSLNRWLRAMLGEVFPCGSECWRALRGDDLT